MRKLLIAALAACALAVAGTAGAALVIAPFDPTGTCTVNTYSHGVLHLEKKCTTETNAAAGADITGFTGQTFATASFTLASPSQCNGGSPRFDIQDATNKVFFLGCNNVTPVTNANGTVTYSFTMADLLRINPTLGAPGTIKAVDILVDVQGSADITRIFFNGVRQVPAASAGGGKDDDNDNDVNDNDKGNGDHHAKGDHGHHNGQGNHGDKHGHASKQGGGSNK